MKKTSLAIFISLLSIAGTTYAQAPSTEIRESTDPAKIAEVEQRAAEIQARQQQSASQMTTSGGSGTEEKKPEKKPSGKQQSTKPAEKGSTGGGAPGASGQGTQSPSK